MLPVIQLFEWRWSRWLLKNTNFEWVLLNIIVPLDAGLMGAREGWNGRCPWCGADHHRHEKIEGLKRLEKLKATQSSEG